MRSGLPRYLSAQPRLFFAAGIGLAIWLVLPSGWRGSTRVLIGWDCATGLYLAMVMVMMARSDIGQIRRRAAYQDDGKIAILGLTTLTALVSLAGIMAELSTAKIQRGPSEWKHITLAGLTVFLSWTFTHAIFALHYAHEYYQGPDGELADGLDFPGTDEPDYWDFIYYSFVIGTACATADVNLTSKRMRRITTVHCMVSFFFNTTILALTVNIGAGLF